MRIGDLVKVVDMRNKNLVSDSPMGINIDKFFMPSVANTIGVDLKCYKLVPRRCFACNLMHVGRDERVPIALNTQDKPLLVSPAYLVFSVKDESVVLPEYLMIWFRRPSFDRNAWFYTASDVRGGLDRQDFFDMEVSVPDLPTQQKIVSQYQAIESRIATNKKLISNLEATAQAIYKKMFIDDIDPEHLPEGWRIGKLSDIAEISSGKSITDKLESPDGDYKYPVAGASGIIGYAKVYNQTERFLTIGRVGTIGIVNRYYDKTYTADNVLVIKSDYYEYCYQIINSINYDDIIKGGVQALVTQTDLSCYRILIPPKQFLSLYEDKMVAISLNIKLSTSVNKYLEEIRQLLEIIL